jgi:hypothetical protein
MASILRAYSVVCWEWVICPFDVYAFISSNQNDVVLPDLPQCLQNLLTGV